LAGCAPTDRDSVTPGSQVEQRLIQSAIRAYYEQNAVEQNNACNAPLMSGVTRSDAVSRDGDEVVVQVRYKYGNYVSRSSRRTCTGFGNRTFTLTKRDGRFRVIDMTGEVRTTPSWRIW
jgi:hypothetical protein